MGKLIMEDKIINIEVEQAPINKVLSETGKTISLDFTDFEEIPYCLGQDINNDEINLETIEADGDSDEDFDFNENNIFEIDGDHLFLNNLDFDFNLDDLF